VGDVARFAKVEGKGRGAQAAESCIKVIRSRQRGSSGRRGSAGDFLTEKGQPARVGTRKGVESTGRNRVQYNTFCEQWVPSIGRALTRAGGPAPERNS